MKMKLITQHILEVGYITSESNLPDKYLANNAKTISSWVRTTNTSSSLSGFLGIGQDGTKTGMLCGIKSGYLYFDTGMYNLYYSNTSYIADGNWHFICITFDSSTLKIYVDNNNVYTQTRYNKYTSSVF